MILLKSFYGNCTFFEFFLVWQRHSDKNKISANHLWKYFIIGQDFFSFKMRTKVLVMFYQLPVQIFEWLQLTYMFLNVKITLATLELVTFQKCRELWRRNWNRIIYWANIFPINYEISLKEIQTEHNNAKFYHSNFRMNWILLMIILD